MEVESKMAMSAVLIIFFMKTSLFFELLIFYMSKLLLLGYKNQVQIVNGLKKIIIGKRRGIKKKGGTITCHPILFYSC
jgi:hypothetical protein